MDNRSTGSLLATLNEKQSHIGGFALSLAAVYQFQQFGDARVYPAYRKYQPENQKKRY
mgnify:CR=1 FL=1